MKIGDHVIIINNDNNESDPHIVKLMDRLISKTGVVKNIVYDKREHSFINEDDKAIDFSKVLVDVDFVCKSKVLGLYHRTFCFKYENIKIKI